MLFQQRADVRPAPPKLDEGFECVPTAAARENGIEKALRGELKLPEVVAKQALVRVAMKMPPRLMFTENFSTNVASSV